MTIRWSGLSLVLSLSLPLVASAAPQPGQVDESAKPETEWFQPPASVESTAGPVVDPAAEAGSAFVARAIAQRSTSLTIGSASSLGGYTLPVNLQVMPSLWFAKQILITNSDSLFSRDLVQSTIAVQYVPLIVRRPPGQQTGVSTSADRTGSVTYTLPLLGTASRSAYDNAITDAVKALRDPTVLVQEAAEKLARNTLQADAARFSLQASAGYGWDTRPGKPDSANAGLTATWILTPTPAVLAGKDSVWILNAAASETRFESAGGISSFFRFTATSGLDYQLAGGPTVSLAPTWDHYSSAAGYQAIVGTPSGNRQFDIAVKEAVTLKALTAKVQLAVVEQHLGTPLHDVAIKLALNYKLPWPKDTSKASP